MNAIQTHPVLEGSPYEGYVYAYPHKTAFRTLLSPQPLAGAWAAEPDADRFLYLHRTRSRRERSPC